MSEQLNARVSALMFAVGLGAAVLAGAGVASADSTDSDSSSGSSSAASSGSEASGTQSGASPASSGSSSTSSSSSSTSSSSSSTEPSAKPQRKRKKRDADGQTAASHAPSSADDHETASKADDASAPDTEAKKARHTAEDSAQGGAEHATTAAAPIEPTSGVATLSSSSNATEPEDPVQPPANPSLLELTFAAVRRLFTNESPTAAPAQIGENAAGVVTGVLFASDPDSRLLRYRVTQQGASGQLVVHTNGTYTYTPDEAFAEAGGEDTVMVEVRDIGLRSLLLGTRRTTVPLTVSVGAGTDQNVGGLPVGLAVSPDGTRAYLTNQESNTVSVINTATREIVGVLRVGDSPYGVAVSPDGTRAYVVNSGDSTASVINTSTLAFIGSPIYVGNSPTSVAFHPSGSRAYVTNSADDTVSVINTATREVISTIGVGDSPYGVAVTPDGTRAYVTNESDNSVSVIDLGNNAVIAAIAVGVNPTGVVVRPDGVRVYVANHGSSLVEGDGSVSVIDTASNTVVDIDPATDGVQGIGTGESPIGLALSPDGAKLYVTDWLADAVNVVDTNTNALVDTDPATPEIDGIAVDEGPVGIAVGPSGQIYVAESAGGSLSAISPAAPASGVAAMAALTTDTGAYDVNPVGPATSVTTTLLSTKRVILGICISDCTRGFDIINFTKHPLKLTYQGPDRPASGPLEGSVLQPGESWHFDNTFYAGKRYSVVPILTAPTGEKWWAFQEIGELGYPRVSCGHDGGGGVCEPASWNNANPPVVFKDAPNSNVTLDSSQRTNVTNILNLCANGKVKCEFDATKQDPNAFSTAPWLKLAENTNSHPSLPQNITFRSTRVFSEQKSWETTATAGVTIKKIVELGIEHTFGGQQTSSETFGWDITIPNVPPGGNVALYGKPPVVRTEGQFTVTMGNTKWTIVNAFVEKPDKAGRGLKTDTTDGPPPPEPVV